MNKTLFQYEMKRSFKTWFIFSAVLTMYTGMIVWMFDPKLGESLNMLMESMPEIFALVGMDSPGTTLLDFINNYLFSFLYKVFPIVFLAFLVNRVLIRYMDRGTMGYLLATSNSRLRIAFTQAAVILVQLFLLLAYVAVLTVVIGEIQFPGQLDVGAFLLEMGGLMGLMVFLSGVCYLSGCIFDESGKALGVGVGLNVLFVLVEMISQVSEKFDWLRFCTPMSLFDTEKIANGDVKLMLILYIAGLAFYGIGMTIFCKKDMNL